MADAMTPSYIVINPDGTIGADFTGHVHAAGLDLDEADLIASVQHGVNWLDAGRNVVEGLYGVELGGVHMVFMKAGAQASVLFIEDGSSPFLQLADGAHLRQIDQGTATAAVNGLNNATKVITPGMAGRVPIVVLPIPRASPSAIAQVTAKGVNSATVQIAHRDAAATFTADVNFDWLAIG